MGTIPTVEIVVNGRRKIVNADDPRAQKPQAPSMDLTREGIAKMPKDKVIALLEAHRVPVDKRSSVAKLRDMAARVVIVDL